MQDQPICKPAGDEPTNTERNVLCLLLESPTPGPWSVDELTRELGNELLAVDAIVGLHAAGLVHRCHELYSLPGRPCASTSSRTARAESAGLERLTDRGAAPRRQRLRSARVGHGLVG